MATTIEDLKSWFLEGKARKANFMIVVCDTFDWEDYPVFISKDENIRTAYDKYQGPNMQKVMEVYNLSKDFDKQQRTGRFAMDFGEK